MTGRGALVLAAVLLAGCGGRDDGNDANDGSQTSPAPGGERRVETLARGLEAPWEIAFLPDRRALITERPGRVRLLSESGELRDEPVARVDVVSSEGAESGLLGLAVDPGFGDNGFVYLYRSTPEDNEVVRYRFADDELQEDGVVLDGIPVGAIHDGGRLAFGPDRQLYVTTGEAGDDALAQDPNSLGGKVLRIEDPRQDNARADVFTLGHRNVQGIDWQPGTETPVITEFGPESDDEINVLEQGANYGWPDVQGDDDGGGRFEKPIRTYENVIAPSGAAFLEADSEWQGDYLVAALRGTQLRRLTIEDGRVTGEDTLLADEYGRLRAVVEGPDGAVYVLTSNRDGRGDPADDDDRVLRITPPNG